MNTMACTEIQSIIDKFVKFTAKPVKYLAVQDGLKDDIKTLIKTLYDYMKRHETNEQRKKKGALPELIVEDFDEEQIWQEIELQNNQCWDQFVSEVAKSLSTKTDLLFPVEIHQETENEIESESEDPETENIQQDNIKPAKQKKSKKKSELKPKSKPSIVDDKFFKLKDMEQFLLKEEKQDGKKNKVSGSDDESVDMFEDIDDGLSDEESRTDVMYSDFFDQGEEDEDNENGVQSQDDDSNNQIEETNDDEMTEMSSTKKKVRFSQPTSSEDEADVSDNISKNNKSEKNNENKSEFELRQQRLKQQIERLEEKTLKEAPWQLKGEVDALKRPQNSLLQEIVDFDLTSRPPPIITEETTITLEELIKRRIKDKAWDDVVKKEKPVDDQLSFRKKEIIDQSKSKLSLAQVYEAEYLKQKQALSGEKEDENEPEGHKEIRQALTDLFSKLDALCHYHYTPKPPQAEVKIVGNTPAISMEEVAPVATSDAALLAPEEVKRKRRGDLISKDERTQTDKNRERRKKKKFQRVKGGHVSKVTDNRQTEKGKEVNDKSLKTSKAFFQQLNNDTTSLIKSKNHNAKKKG